MEHLERHYRPPNLAHAILYYAIHKTFRIRWIGFPYKHCYSWLVLPARLHGFQNRDEVYFGEVKAPSMPVSILQRNIRIQYFFSWNKLTKGDSSSLGLFQLFVPPGFVASWCRSYRKLIPYFDVYKMVRTLTCDHTLPPYI